jgi:hypothetical protein
MEVARWQASLPGRCQCLEGDVSANDEHGEQLVRPSMPDGDVTAVTLALAPHALPWPG